MEESMKELVMAAGQGQQWAFARLYEKTYQKAYYLALQLLKNGDEAQDILHDSYIKAFNSLNTLERAEVFESWFDRIVVNRCKDYLKKKKPLLFSQMLPDDSSQESFDWEDTKEQFSPEKEIDYQETKRLIQGMIDELPEQQRIAMILHYLEDMPVAEIAQMMECSEGTIKSRLNYGRKAIKEKVLLLEKKGTKLYCMPLVPFLYWMFRNNALSVVISAELAERILAGAGMAAVAAGAGGATGAGNAAGAEKVTADGSAAGTGSTAVGITTATIIKIAAVVTAAGVCAGIFLAAGKIGESSNHTQSEVLASVTAAREDPGSPVHESFMVETGREQPDIQAQQYEKIIAEYGTQLEEIYQYCLNGDLDTVHGKLLNGDYEALVECIYKEWSNHWEVLGDGFWYPSSNGEECIKLYKQVGIPEFSASSPGPYLYYGPLAEGEREGYGHWLQANHHYYYFAGNWQNDKPNGQGTVIEEQPGHGKRVIIGTFKNGLEHGSMYAQRSYDDVRTDTFYFESVEGKRQPNAADGNGEPCVKNEEGVILDTGSNGGYKSYCGVDGFYTWHKSGG